MLWFSILRLDSGGTLDLVGNLGGQDYKIPITFQNNSNKKCLNKIRIFWQNKFCFNIAITKFKTVWIKHFNQIFIQVFSRYNTIYIYNVIICTMHDFVDYL